MRRPHRLVVICGLALAIGLATAVAPFASGSPDGLAAVAEEQGFADSGRLHPAQDASPIPDYAVPGLEDERVATGLAGFAGTLAVFALGSGVAWLLRRRAEQAPSQAAVGGRGR